jgi:hypothetical protein
MNLTKILEDLIIDIAEVSPLSDKEEALVRKLKPALKKMKDKYGEEKGKEYFYGMIRNRSKHTK